MDVEWERRLAQLWELLDALGPEEFVAWVDALAGELPAGSAVAAFERGCARDSTGHPDLAVPLYRRALGLGLDAPRRRRAVIQLASSLRNLGRAGDAVELLREERTAGSDELDDAVAAFLALALADTGREREGLALALAALAPHLPRYQRSLGAYAGMLTAAPDSAGS